MNIMQKYVLHLLDCSLNNKMPEELPAGVGLEELLEYSISEHLTSAIYYSLEKLTLPDDDSTMQIMHRFKQKAVRAVVREYNQELLIDEISEVLSNTGVKHVFLKGSVIKYLYPIYDFRQMGDIDVLVNDKEKINESMSSLGFECISAQEVHDIFERGKQIIEIHYRLVRKTNQSFAFCEKVWEHSYSVGQGLKYMMENEFLYVYLLAHLNKHLMSGGAGIKLILDLYVLRKQELDIEKIQKYVEMAKLTSIYKYEQKIEEYWFEGIEPSDKMVLFLSQYILDNGVFGDENIGFNISYSEKDRLKKYLRNVFPEKEHMEYIYPQVKQYPVLLPLMWILRILKILFSKKYSVRKFVEQVNSRDKSMEEFWYEFKKELSK